MQLGTRTPCTSTAARGKYTIKQYCCSVWSNYPQALQTEEVCHLFWFDTSCLQLLDQLNEESNCGTWKQILWSICIASEVYAGSINKTYCFYLHSLSWGYFLIMLLLNSLITMSGFWCCTTDPNTLVIWHIGNCLVGWFH